MSDKLRWMKETLICAAENQLCNLEEVDAKELGEVIDMIKDLEEAEYYCAVVKAMKESDKQEEHYQMYYTDPMMPNGVYYDEKEMPSHMTHMDDTYMMGMNKNSMPQMDKEMMMDPKAGKSHMSRKMYMEAKEKHSEKAIQMRELEKYVQELAQDVVEMIEGSSPEEKQYLSKKISALATKVTQLND